MSTSTDLFDPAQLAAELRHALYAADGALLGSADCVVEARELAGRLSIERGAAVAIRALRHRDEVVDMPALRRDATEVLAQVMDRENELQGDESREDLAAKLGAAIASDSCCTLFDTLHDTRWALGLFCTHRKCTEQLEEPEIGGYCSRDCWAQDDGGA